MHDVNTVYSIPLLLHSQQVDEILLKSLNLSKVKKPNLSDWKKVVDAKLHPKNTVEIAIVSKYVDLKDSYKSQRAFEHAGIINHTKVNLSFIDASKLNPKNVKKMLSFADGILIPGGFGKEASRE